MEQAVADEDERLSMDDDGRYSDLSDYSADENDLSGNRSFDAADEALGVAAAEANSPIRSSPEPESEAVDDSI